jgi:hypothetical protein
MDSNVWRRLVRRRSRRSTVADRREAARQNRNEGYNPVTPTVTDSDPGESAYEFLSGRASGEICSWIDVIELPSPGSPHPSREEGRTQSRGTFARLSREGVAESSG